MKNTSIITFFIGLMVLSACKKEQTREEKLQDVLKETEISCSGIQSEYYFHGFLNGEEICYSSGFEDYYIYNTFVTGAITTKPSISFNDTSNYALSGRWFIVSLRPSFDGFQDYKHFINIETPAVDTGFSSAENRRLYLENLLQNGIFPVRSISDDLYNGFEISFEIPSEVDREKWNVGYTNYKFTTSNGSQDDSYFEITKINKTEDEEHYYYELELEFSVKLYYPSLDFIQEETDFYGELTDAKVVTLITLQK